MEENRDKPWNFHTCKFCSYRTKSVFVMCSHVRLHASRSKTDTFLCKSKTPEMLECEICEFSTNLKVDLTEHFRVFHAEKEANREVGNVFEYYRCKNCNFGTHSMLVLLKHVDNCNAVSIDYSHKERRTMNKILPPESHTRPKGRTSRKCKHCCYVTSHTSRMKSHVLCKHTDPKDINWLKCAECAYKCIEKKSLKRHMKNKHVKPEDINWLKCDQCPFQIRHMGYLERHIRFKHGNRKDRISQDFFRCEQCSYESRDKSYLRKHIKTKHSKPEDINWCTCEQCPLQFKRKCDLRKHIKTRHTNPKDINWLKCDQCNHKTKDKYTLKLHVLVKHDNIESTCSGEKNGCRCVQCVLERHSIAKHMNPENTNMFKCELCPYQSRQTYHLKIHILTKHEQRLKNDTKTS